MQVSSSDPDLRLDVVVDTEADPVDIDEAAPRGPIDRIRVEPREFVSEETLFGDLEALEAIAAFRGWRNSASSGEHAAVDWLETVSHVRQGAPHNDAHRVIEVGLLHLLFETYREQFLCNFSHMYSQSGRDSGRRRNPEFTKIPGKLLEKCLDLARPESWS